MYDFVIPGIKLSRGFGLVKSSSLTGIAPVTVRYYEPLQMTLRLFAIAADFYWFNQ